MAINAGVNISKLVGYAVLAPPPGVGIEKLVGYAVLAPPPGVGIEKLVGYAVLGSTNVNGPVWTAITFGTGVVGVAYSQQFDLAPAAAPTTFSLVSGALPTGLALSNISDDIGRIAGTPTAAGTFNFTLRATNVYATADQAFTITVAPAAGGGSLVWMA